MTGRADRWGAVLTALSADGMIVAASTTLLQCLAIERGEDATRYLERISRCLLTIASWKARSPR